MSSDTEAIIMTNADDAVDIEAVMPAEETPPQRLSYIPSRWSYVRSDDFREFICCFAFAIVCSIVELVNASFLNERPIPVQALGNGDFVLNLTLNNEWVGDTVSSTTAAFVAVVIPMVLQVILSKCGGKVGDAHASVCVYFVAEGLTSLVTGLVKYYVGYLRPVFYDMCEPDANYEECTSGDSEARKSFPSGHSSVSFCGLIIFTLYLLDRYGVANQATVLRETPTGDLVVQYQKPPRVKRAISVLCLSPMALAVFIAASRVADNMHHPADVVGGAIIGSTLGLFVYRLWFPSWSLR